MSYIGNQAELNLNFDITINTTVLQRNVSRFNSILYFTSMITNVTVIQQYISTRRIFQFYYTSVKMFPIWSSGDKRAIFHSSWIYKLYWENSFHVFSGARFDFL